MQSSQIFGFLSIFTTYLLLTACGGGGSESNDPSSAPTTGFSATAVHTNSVTSSPYCPAGGVEILTGIDVNQNGVLDPNEVNDTQELCHIDSDRILAQVENLSANTECINGGHRLYIGYDLNQNDLIDTDEVNQSVLFCAQSQFSGLALAVFREDIEPEGDNCTYGGYRKSIGVDINNNGSLDIEEITSSQYTCQSNLPISPYQNRGYCFELNCDVITDNYLKRLIRGDEDPEILAWVYDDGIGDITVSLDENAPEWLELSIVQSEYDPIVHYVLVDQSQIPQSASGQTYNITITVSDDTHSIDYVKTIKVVDPVKITLSEVSLSVNEPGSANELTKFVKVLFEPALPEIIYSELGNYYSLSDYFIDAYRYEGSDLRYQSLSNEDFTISWVGDSLFKGQSEATLMIKIKDDYLPEGNERFRIAIGPNSYNHDSDLRFVKSSFELEIIDDSDAEIVANIELESNSVVEGNTADNNITELAYSLNFESPLPSNGSIQLGVRPIEQASSATGNDVGFGSSCLYESNYCNQSQHLSLIKGITEYSGTLQIVGDTSHELDETYELYIKTQASSFRLDDLSASFVIQNDDAKPEIGFQNVSSHAYYASDLVYLPITLSSSTYEELSFSIEVGTDSTLIEGTHYDFAVSRPIHLKPGASGFDLPIIIYGKNFDEAYLEAEFTIEIDSGVIDNIEKRTTTLRLDKITPLKFFSSALPLSVEGSFYYDDPTAGFVDAASNFYRVGLVTGVISGQTQIGGTDFYVAKYDSAKELLWARQFGTTSSENHWKSTIDIQSSSIIISSNRDIFHISSTGVVTNLSLLLGDVSVFLYDAKTDQSGNLYFVGRKSYWDDDVDGDGSSSEFILAKFNPAMELQWIEEDFTDIQENHGNLRFELKAFQLSNAGVPYLFGEIYPGSFTDEPQLGGTDNAVVTFAPETGVVTNASVFGSNNSENTSIYTAAYENNRIIAFYNIDDGDIVGGQTASDHQGIKVVIEGDGSISEESFIEHPASSPTVKAFVQSTDGTYFMLEGNGYAYNNYSYKHLDENLNVITEKLQQPYSDSLTNYFQRPPVLAEDGGYIVSKSTEFAKMLANFELRLP